MTQSRLVFLLLIGVLLAPVTGLLSTMEPAQAALCSNSYVEGQTALTDLGAGAVLRLRFNASPPA